MGDVKVIPGEEITKQQHLLVCDFHADIPRNLPSTTPPPIPVKQDVLKDPSPSNSDQLRLVNQMRHEDMDVLVHSWL